jgi:hypothetical protein
MVNATINASGAFIGFPKRAAGLSALRESPAPR